MSDKNCCCKEVYTFNVQASSIGSTPQKVVIKCNSDFRVGDVVQFKTGGPNMVVIGVDDATIKCEWWDSNRRKFFCQCFVLEALNRY